jgi:hypothetical protein
MWFQATDLTTSPILEDTGVIHDQYQMNAIHEGVTYLGIV